MEAASSANLQELRRRVWYLPHVCVAIFEELVKSLGPEDCHFDFLRPYLTLDKATCLDLAPMLYDYIILGQFPWHCPDEERKRAYAAGVLNIDMTGGLPLCVRWTSFNDMLDFFPNAETIVFGSGDIIFEKNGSPWERPSTFFISDTIWVKKDGSVMGAIPFFPVDDFTYNVVRRLRAGWREEGARPFFVHENGQVDVPQAFLQPLRHFAVYPGPQEHDDWLTILKHRTAAEVRTDCVCWTMGIEEERDVLPRLAQAVPSALRSLILEAGSVRPLSVSLDTLMDIIDVKHFPNLERLHLKLHFFQGSMRDAEARHMGRPSPSWLANALPPKLKIYVHLVLSNQLVNEYSDDGSASQALFDTLPLLWIENARRKLGENRKDCLFVHTFRSQNGREKPFEPPSVLARLEHALHGPKSW